MESVLVALGMTEWMCIATVMHISQFRLSKQVSLWTCFYNSSNIGEMFSICDCGYTGKFLNIDETIVEGEQNIFYKKVWRAIRYRLRYNL